MEFIEILSQNSNCSIIFFSFVAKRLGMWKQNTSQPTTAQSLLHALYARYSNPWLPPHSYKFLTDHNLISPPNMVSWKNIQPQQTFTSLRDWISSLSNHKSSHICSIDFQRAFDTISHTKLIHKLASYGISGNLLFWIQAFLTNRQQCGPHHF